MPKITDRLEPSEFESLEAFLLEAERYRLTCIMLINHIKKFSQLDTHDNDLKALADAGYCDAQARLNFRKLLRELGEIE